jgi:small subunit ribosomal protein S15
VAILTERINNLVRHMVQHKKDHATKRGLQMLVAQRQKLLAYMKNRDFESFKRVVQELGLQAEAQRILD